MMRKLLATYLLILAALLHLPYRADAVVANPGPYTYTQPDGSKITLSLRGDEFNHWYVNSQGKTMHLGPDGFFRESSPEDIKAARAMGYEKRMTRQAISVNKSISTGEKHFLVVLIEFSDLGFTVQDPRQAFYNLLNQEGYSRNGGTGSARDYYMDNSLGQFAPIFDVVGPVRLSRNMSYYGAVSGSDNDAHPDEALKEACELLDDEVDFSKYDLDNNGYVDNIFYYYAGHNEAEGASSNTIWPHKWSLWREECFLDGVRIYDYACTSEYRGPNGNEMCGIGTFCHEFGHVIGLPDLYDTDYESNGRADDLGNFSLMCGGNYNNKGRTPPYLNCVERNILGWMEPAEEWFSTGTKTLESVKNNVAFRTPATTAGEWFVFENRDGTGWDEFITAGLVIYHLDQSDRLVHGQSAKNRWKNWNGINCYADHPCFYIIDAGTIERFTEASSPAFLDWNKKGTGFEITDIRFSDNIVTLYLDAEKNKTISGIVSDANGNPLGKVWLALYDPVNKRTSQAQSEKSGHYILGAGNVTNQDFELYARKEGYINLKTSVEIPSGTVTKDIILVESYSENTVGKDMSGMGLNTIAADKKEYRKGDRFTFKLNQTTMVKAVQWYYDGSKTNSTSVSLTSGTHKIKAAIDHYDGSKEYLYLTLEVK